MDGGGVPPALEKNAAELTVMDVYDIASAVGQEFERVIDQHGCEAIARLMPKVVRVLEILEVLVSRNHINPEMEELRLELDRLRLERMDRIEKERKHQKVRAGSGGTRRGRAVPAAAAALGGAGLCPPAAAVLPPPPPGKQRAPPGCGPGCRGSGRGTRAVQPGRAHGSARMLPQRRRGFGRVVVFCFLPSWKFPPSFPFSTPSPVAAFPSPECPRLGLLL